jgi:hypothetical protein
VSPALWLTVRHGTRRIPIPVFVLLPFVLVVDILALVGLCVYGALARKPHFIRIGSGLYLTRLAITFLLHGERLKIRVADGDTRVAIYGGLIES